MADNITLSAGPVVKTNEIGGVHYPVGKVAFGGSAAATLASFNAGNADDGTQRVVLASDQAAIEISNSDLPAIATSVATIAAAVDTEMQVDVVSSALPTGAATAAAQATAEAEISNAVALLTTIDADTSTLAGAVSAGAVEVRVVAYGDSVTDDSVFSVSGQAIAMVGGVFGASSISASGNAGAFGMTSDRAILVSIIRDDVGIGGGTQYTEDVATPAAPVGNALMVERDDALGGVTPAEGDWTHLLCDANGALWVNIGGATVDVSSSDLAAIAAAVSGTEMQVDIVSLPNEGQQTMANSISVAIASDQSAVEISHSDLPAIATDMATLAGAVSGTEMQVDVVTDQPLQASADSVRALADVNTMMNGATSVAPAFAVINFSASGTNTLVSALGASTACRVLSMWLVAEAGTTISIRSAGTPLSGDVVLTAHEGFVLNYSPIGHFETSDNAALVIVSSAPTQIGGSLRYVAL